MHIVTRLEPKLKKKSYEERLKTLKITTFEDRKRRGGSDSILQGYKWYRPNRME